MKILRISLRNIASLAGTHTVDFTQEPLRSAGLFSICGPTGAGKSTLLDALCLALYDNTPRLSVVPRGASLQDGTKTVSQKDPGNLLRRGTAEGFAEVAFVGVDNETYTARWKIRRARNQPGGALQNPEMTLARGNVVNADANLIAQGEKKGEVLRAIQAKVGLSYEQFARAVLLAQNEFAAFLKANDSERAEILQALTGTERFAAISIEVFARCTREQKAVEEIKDRLAANPSLPPVERTAAENALAAAEAEVRALEERVKLREAHAIWFKQWTQLTATAGEAERSLDATRKLQEQARPRRSLLDQAVEIAAEARPLRDEECRLTLELTAAETSSKQAAAEEAEAKVERESKSAALAEAKTGLGLAKMTLDRAQPTLVLARALDATLLPRRQQLADIARDRAAAEMELQQARAERDARMQQQQAAQKEHEDLTARRSALAPIAPLAEHAAAWLQRLDQAANARDALAKAEVELKKWVKAETKLQKAMATEAAREPSLGSAAETALSRFKKAEAAAGQFDGEKTASARRDADAARTALLVLDQNLREIQKLFEESQHLEGEIAKLRSLIETDATVSARLRTEQIPTAKTALDRSRESLELARAAVANATQALREGLIPNRPCPVCGATEHPYTAHPPGLETVALRALEDDWKRKGEAHLALSLQEAGLAGLHHARIVEIASKTKALAECSPRLQAARSAHHEHPEAKEILRRPEHERAGALAGRLAALEQAIKATNDDDEKRRAAEKERDARRAARDEALQTLASLEKKLAGFREELAGLSAGRAGAEKTRDATESSLRNCRNELEPLLAIPELRLLWDRDAAGARRRFSELAAERAAVEQRAAGLEQELREHAAVLGPAQAAVARAESAVVAKKGEEASAQSAAQEIESQRASLFDGRAVELVEAELKKALTEATETHAVRAEEFAAADRRFAVAAAHAKTTEAALSPTRDALAAAEAKLDVWLNWFAMRWGSALVRSTLDERLAATKEWITQERAALDAIDDAVTNAEGAFKARQETLAAHAALRPTLEEESAVIADLSELHHSKADKEKLRAAARAVLLADDQSRTRGASLSQELEARRLALQPWERLNELIGSASGAKFRDIAQRPTLDLLLGYANRQLDLLAPRYHLQRLAQSLNLIVIDRDMGDDPRSVHSLSGGESFLVSLALALGLASLTSNRLRIESLFIDEGFGSLDPETLGVAMGALMRLEAQGRKVGVISHVAEMAEAIPVQIRVEKGRSGASRLTGAGVTTAGA